MAKTYLSWDCANKTLAWCYFTIDVEPLRAIDVNRNTWITELDAALGSLFQVHSFGVIDLLGGRKVTDVSDAERARLLHKFLQTMPTPGGNFTTIIEHQPPKVGHAVNTRAQAVGYQLAFHYSPGDLILIDPKLKDRICVGEGLHLSDFGQKNKHAARKAHSAANFEKIMHAFGREDIIKSIPKSSLNNLADAFNQAVLYALRGL